MTLEDWLESRYLTRHTTSRREIQDLRRSIPAPHSTHKASKARPAALDSRAAPLRTDLHSRIPCKIAA